MLPSIRRSVYGRSLLSTFGTSDGSVTLEWMEVKGLRFVRLAVGLVVLGAAFGAQAAEAQKGVFGTLTAVFAPSGNGYSSYGTAGLGVGIYDTLLRGGPVAVGFEVRGLAAPSTYELMAGGRLVIAGRKFRPYGVVLVGLEGQRNGTQSTSSQVGYQAGGGLDISQGRWIDWRAVDITGGQLLTASTGVVVRF